MLQTRIRVHQPEAALLHPKFPQAAPGTDVHHAVFDLPIVKGGFANSVLVRDSLKRQARHPYPQAAYNLALGKLGYAHGGDS